MSQLCGTTASTASSSLATDASVGPASVIVGNLVQGNRLAAAQGRDLGFTEDNKVRNSPKFNFNGFLIFKINSASTNHGSPSMARKFITRSCPLHAPKCERCCSKDFNMLGASQASWKGCCVASRTKIKSRRSRWWVTSFLNLKFSLNFPLFSSNFPTWFGSHRSLLRLPLHRRRSRSHSSASRSKSHHNTANRSYDRRRLQVHHDPLHPECH